MGDISRNFSSIEFTRSGRATDAGIDNRIPTAAIRDSIISLVRTVLQPLRDSLGASIIVNSGYRCPKLNALVNGAKASQHMKGEAADIRSAFFRPVDLARRILALRLPFDQVILYPGFIHVSHKKDGPQRGKVLYDASYHGEKV